MKVRSHSFVYFIDVLPFFLLSDENVGISEVCDYTESDLRAKIYLYHGSAYQSHKPYEFFFQMQSGNVLVQQLIGAGRTGVLTGDVTGDWAMMR